MLRKLSNFFSCSLLPDSALRAQVDMPLVIYPLESVDAVMLSIIHFLDLVSHEQLHKAF